MIDFHQNLPKISCLLVTAKNRFEYFQKSFQCYVDQTYPNKELVVVNEGPNEYQKQIKEFVGERNDVKFVFLDGWYSLGALRNISISLSTGEIFVQWDDDDFNMPERLAVQYSHLLKHPKSKICYLSDQLHYYFNSNYLFWEDWKEFCSWGNLKYSLIPGTLMAWRKDFHFRYPSAGQWCSSGEDSVLADKLINSNEENITLLSGFGYIQVYTFHGKNVWDIDHHLAISRQRSLNASHLIQNRKRICQLINYLKLPGVTKVMGREGLAFMHEAVK